MSIATFALEQQSWVVATETVWNVKPKIVTYYLALFRKLADLCINHRKEEVYNKRWCFVPPKGIRV